MSDEAAKREAPGLPDIDVREWGGKKDGERQVLDRRLFMQLLVFDVDRGAAFGKAQDQRVHAIGAAGVAHVV